MYVVNVEFLSTVFRFIDNRICVASSTVQSNWDSRQRYYAPLGTTMFGPLLTFYTPSVACLVLALVYPMYVACNTCKVDPTTRSQQGQVGANHRKPRTPGYRTVANILVRSANCTRHHVPSNIRPGCCLGSSPLSRGCWGGCCATCHCTTYSRRCWCSGLLHHTRRVPTFCGAPTCDHSLHGTHRPSCPEWGRRKR